MANALDSAALLREARARAGLSQRALADRAGTAQSVVARIELGLTDPSTSTLRRLLEAAGHELRVELSLLPEKPRRAQSLASRITAFFVDENIPGLASAYLFGSAAREARHAESDVDVAVLLDPTIHSTHEARGQLRVDIGSALIAATHENEVDLVVLNDAPPGLARAIVVEGRRVLCLDQELDHAFRRDAQLRWADLRPFLQRMSALKLEALRR